MKRKKSPPPPANNSPKEPEFANNPLQAALTARLDKDKKDKADKDAAAAKAKALAKPPQAGQAQPKQHAAPPQPAPLSAPEPARTAAKARSTRGGYVDTHTSQHSKQTTKIPQLPDRPLSAQELFEFALQQLPAELKPYDLKFGSGAESPKLPDIDDQANKKAQAAQAAHAAASSAHLTQAQREALREATRVRELKSAFEQEMRDTGVRRVEQSKIADLQTAAATAASVAAIAGRPLEPARRSLSQESHPSPDLLAQLHDGDALAIPINFTFAQKRLLERAQRKDDPIPEVSLRGLTLAEALPVLQNFLNAQRNAGQRTVRVITGKGKQSEGEPVLKGAVESYFLSVGAPLVTAFAPEVTRDGDFGAYAVQLKKVTKAV